MNMGDATVTRCHLLPGPCQQILTKFWQPAGQPPTRRQVTWTRQDLAPPHTLTPLCLPRSSGTSSYIPSEVHIFNRKLEALWKLEQFKIDDLRPHSKSITPFPNPQLCLPNHLHSCCHLGQLSSWCQYYMFFQYGRVSQRNSFCVLFLLLLCFCLNILLMC